MIPSAAREPSHPPIAWFDDDIDDEFDDDDEFGDDEFGDDADDDEDEDGDAEDPEPWQVHARICAENGGAFA